jgi:hypothetical protein
MDHPQIFEVRRAIYLADFGGKQNWFIFCWCYEWDGQALDKLYFQFNIEEFNDTKPINTLPCYPLEFYGDDIGNQNTTDLKKNLIKTAKHYRTVCTRGTGAKQMFQYKGRVLSFGIGINKHENKVQVSNRPSWTFLHEGC